MNDDVISQHGFERSADELDLVLGGNGPSGQQIAPDHANHVTAFAGAGTAIGAGIGFAVAGLPGAATGAGVGGAIGVGVGIAYEVYEHHESIGEALNGVAEFYATADVM